MNKLLSSIGLFALASSKAIAGEWVQVPLPTVTESDPTPAIALLLAVGAVLMLKGVTGASASEKRKDQAADEE